MLSASSARARQLLAVPALAVALAVPVMVPAVHADVDAPPALSPVSASPAEQALERAWWSVTGAPGAGAPTLALRDLALREHELTGQDKALAAALLSRPNGGNTRNDIGVAVWPSAEAPESAAGAGCSDDPATPVCVHWTDSSRHAPPPADADDDGVPNWVETTLAEMENVWRYEVGFLGLRPPLPDNRASIDADGTYFDVYLSDIGSRGYYGYCTIDDSRTRFGYRHRDYAGYCVLDDDFSRAEFPRNSALENLRVTAAHEFFHAIQFAYDALEDAWFMEGTAAWIEDEVYDAVNDNRQYLRVSQFRNPERPLDHPRGLAIYGSWGFFRFLTETLDDAVEPELIRRAWERADAAQGGPDDYSMQAIRRAVRQVGGDFDELLATFGLALAEPRAFLSEGAAYPSSSRRLALGRDGTATRQVELDHTSYAPLTIRPERSSGPGARLTLQVDGPRRASSPAVRVMSVRADGSFGRVRTVDLNRRGAGRIQLPFAQDDVRRVLVSLANRSTDYRRCFTWTTRYSCDGGVPVHSDQRFRIRATVR